MSLTAITVIMAIGLFSSSNITMIEPDRISIIDLWIERFEGIDYVRGKYDCTQFSNDFRDTLKPYFNVTIVYGMIKGQDMMHCWLEINGRPFEATSGHWIGFNAYNERYKKFKNIHRCW